MADFAKMQDDIIAKLKDGNSYGEVLESMKQCHTNKDRVFLVLQIPTIQESLNITPTRNEKSAGLSVQFRNEGNKYFQKGEYQSALNKYNQSAVFAPSPTHNWNDLDEGKDVTHLELSYALANRSAVFYHQKRYQTCLQDIELSVESRYPKSLIYKLHERKAKCFMEMKDFEKANESFQNTLNSLTEAELEEKKHETIKTLVMKNLERCREKKSSSDNALRNSFEQFHGPVPFIKEKSDVVLSASDSIGITKNEEIDFGLIANKDIPVGEVVIVERAYASIVLPKFDQIYCHHCCHRVIAAFPCQQCSEVMYCSDLCSKASWEQYHNFECKCLATVKGANFGLGYLSMKMVLKAGLSQVLEYQKEEKEDGCIRSVGLNLNGKYDSEDYNTVYNLVNHSEKRTPEDLFKRTLQACFLLKCLEATNFFAKDRTETTFDEKCYVTGHVLRHIMMLPCNAHEVSELAMKPSNLPESETIEIGSGIYPVLSLINHSCDPNVVRHSYGDICVVRAIKNIEVGEEIVDNYGALYPLTVRSERHATLEPQYYFTCQCKPCCEDWPLYFNIPADVPKFRCKKCNGPVIIPPDRKTENAFCTKCRNKQDVTSAIVKLHQSQTEYQEILQQVLRGERLLEALPKLERYLQFLYKTVCLPWQDCNNCQEAIKQCYAVQANCFIAS